MFINTIGIIKNNLNDDKGAIKYFDKAIMLDSNCAEAYYYRGCAKVNLKDYEGAIGDCNKAIE